MSCICCHVDTSKCVSHSWKQTLAAAFVDMLSYGGSDAKKKERIVPSPRPSLSPMDKRRGLVAKRNRLTTELAVIDEELTDYSIVCVLPVELLVVIMTCLSPADAVSFSMTCKTMRDCLPDRVRLQALLDRVVRVDGWRVIRVVDLAPFGWHTTIPLDAVSFDMACFVHDASGLLTTWRIALVRDGTVQILEFTACCDTRDQGSNTPTVTVTDPHDVRYAFVNAGTCVGELLVTNFVNRGTQLELMSTLAAEDHAINHTCFFDIGGDKIEFHSYKQEHDTPRAKHWPTTYRAYVHSDGTQLSYYTSGTTLVVKPHDGSPDTYTYPVLGKIVGATKSGPYYFVLTQSGSLIVYKIPD